MKTEAKQFEHGLPDGDSMPLLRCICGQTFARWDFVLTCYHDELRECPSCQRKLWWSQVITVHVVGE